MITAFLIIKSPCSFICFCHGFLFWSNLYLSLYMFSHGFICLWPSFCLKFWFQPLPLSLWVCGFPQQASMALSLGCRLHLLKEVIRQGCQQAFIEHRVWGSRNLCHNPRPYRACDLVGIRTRIYRYWTSQGSIYNPNYISIVGRGRQLF